VGEEPLTVLVASTPEQRAQGLRQVEDLEGYDGMLFAYDEPSSATYGMRDTLIPLDIWWFDAEGRLLGSTEMQPCVESNCTSYGSPGPIKWALETPLGQYDFQPGATLSTVENP
jgi:uncharacterized membrane protein (UPF0127 family)